MDSLRLLRAFHEAGHLVAAVALGVDVLAVSLAPGDTSMAGCTTTGRRCTGRCTDAALLASVTDEGVVAAAGRFGEAIWWEGVSGRAMAAARPGCSARITAASVAHDDEILRERARDAAALSGGTAAGAWTARRLADAAAVVAVRRRAVTALAVELYSAGELDGSEVREILG